MSANCTVFPRLASNLRRFACLAALCLLMASLAACGGKGTGEMRTSGKGVGQPYTVRGKTYYPLLSAEGFEQVGMASWYGPGFHGKRTSSGEVFNQNALTAAHTLLPFGSEIEVTNLRNGKSVVVRINDRGPFAESRVIDLSRGAAARIDMIGTGTAKVRLRHVGSTASAAAPLMPVPVATSRPRTAQVEGVFYIQVGAFGKRPNAVNALRTLHRIKLPADTKYERKLWRILAGPWRDLDTANDKLWTVREHFPDAVIVSE